MGQLVQTVFPDISPTLLVFKEKIGPGYLGEEDVEVVIINLYPSYGVKVWLRVGGTLCEKGMVSLSYKEVPNRALWDPLLRQSSVSLLPSCLPKFFCTQRYAPSPHFLEYH